MWNAFLTMTSYNTLEGSKHLESMDVASTITVARQVYRNSECIHIAYIYIPFDSSNQIKSNRVHVDKIIIDTYHIFKHLISNILFFQLDSENQNLQLDRTSIVTEKTFRKQIRMTYIFIPLYCHSCNSSHRFHSQLLHSFPTFLLTAALFRLASFYTSILSYNITEHIKVLHYNQ